MEASSKAGRARDIEEGQRNDDEIWQASGTQACNEPSYNKKRTGRHPKENRDDTREKHIQVMI